MGLLEFNNALMQFNAVAGASLDALSGKHSWSDATAKAAMGVTTAQLSTDVRKQGGPWLDTSNPFGSFNMYQSMRFFSGQPPFRISPNTYSSMMMSRMLSSQPYGLGGGGMYNTTFPMPPYSTMGSCWGAQRGFWC